MPEEINRIVTDRLSSLHLTPSPDADENLLREGAPASGIARVGNCMIDSLLRHLPKARNAHALERFGLKRRAFVLATFHRPSNVDLPARLARLIRALCGVAERLPVVFPVHPRTRARLDALGASAEQGPLSGLLLCEPLGYLDFLQLEDAAKVVVTDSGGVQEETTVLGVPCLTARDSTERPITVSLGTNKVIGADPAAMLGEIDAVLDGRAKQGRIPELWDGQAGQRAGAAIRHFLEARAPA
jgi:UDP-N-acetylglucosamine 2-epimerase (non-hydrolysing)